LYSCSSHSALASSALAQTDFVAFESDPVRPLVLSADGSTLFAVNTPDNHLEIFDVGADGGLQHRGSVPVGMEPVAVGVRGDEAWVVDHLSDRYCQLKSNWADFLPRASNLNAEQSMRYEFACCPFFGQIHLT